MRETVGRKGGEMQGRKRRMQERCEEGEIEEVTIDGGREEREREWSGKEREEKRE